MHYGSSGIRDDSKLGLFFPQRCTVKMKMHHSWGNGSGINQLSSSDIITAICLSSTLILKWALFLTAMHYVGGHSTDFIIHSYGVTARWCKQVLYSSFSSDKELCRLHIFYHKWGLSSAVITLSHVQIGFTWLFFSPQN